jgi:hypothetical protein
MRAATECDQHKQEEGVADEAKLTNTAAPENQTQTS